MNKREIIGGEQYAVIEEVRFEGHAERFVMAYHDEQLLRELIASPRIVATGFRSRDAAMRTAAIERELTAAERGDGVLFTPGRPVFPGSRQPTTKGPQVFGQSS